MCENNAKTELNAIIEINTSLIDIYGQLKNSLIEANQKAKKLTMPIIHNDTIILKKICENIQTFYENFTNVVQKQFTDVNHSFEELKANLIDQANLDNIKANLSQIKSDIVKSKKKYIAQANIKKNYKSSNITNDILKIEYESPSPSRSITRKRGSYRITNPAERFRALELANNLGIVEAAKKLNIPTKNIKRWLKTGPDRKKGEVYVIYFDHKIIGGGRKMLDPIMESKLSAWIKEQEAILGHPLTRTQIKHKARELCTIPGFKASKGWLDKFKKRSNVNFLPMFVENAHLKCELESAKDSTSTLSQGISPVSGLDNDQSIYLDPQDRNTNILNMELIGTTVLNNFTMNFDLLLNNDHQIEDQLKFRRGDDCCIFDKNLDLYHPHHSHSHHHQQHQQQQQQQQQQSNSLINLDFLCPSAHKMYIKSTPEKIMDMNTNLNRVLLPSSLPPPPQISSDNNLFCHMQNESIINPNHYSNNENSIINDNMMMLDPSGSLFLRPAYDNNCNVVDQYLDFTRVTPYKFEL